MSEAVLTAGSTTLAGTGVGTAFGTFGELLQGALPEPESDFLVTLPISRWTTATFTPTFDDTAVRTEPAGKVKSRRLAELMLARYAVAGGGSLLIDSEIPEGKGMASSSADLVATAHAVALSIGVDITPEEVESLLREIEPTDGVMYPCVVAFHHRQVRLRARLGLLPAMTIVGLDEGGTVDTVAFNDVPKPFSDNDRAEYQRLLRDLSAAVAKADLGTVGRVATRSAVLNQRLRFKRTLTSLIGLCDDIGGLGVTVAHSGTTVGVLIADDDPRYGEKVRRARRACGKLTDSVLVERVLRFD